ncbi:hypothetical protein JOB18_033941 [Solea senegalensis]|uniref:Uncharacterized protein n=1 Tax=Solea senegalensis TaxID=28829 RepID=A0AAV6QR45_SOLSE|nr:hypothetical protein JOB18_033941 [Solea senegalensis]
MRTGRFVPYWNEVVNENEPRALHLPTLSVAAALYFERANRKSPSRTRRKSSHFVLLLLFLLLLLRASRRREERHLKNPLGKTTYRSLSWP